MIVTVTQSCNTEKDIEGSGIDNCQKYSIKYIYSTSQILKLSLILYTFSITSSVAGLFLTIILYSTATICWPYEKYIL